MKKWLISLLLILGGIMVFFSLNNPEQNVEDRPILTREQQDNVVRWIVRGYDPIRQVEFLRFSQDNKTGTNLLSIKINDDLSLKTTIRVSDLQVFNEADGQIGLNPAGRFSTLEREIRMPDNSKINISSITVIYLED